jgi:hypothetical protein
MRQPRVFALNEEVRQLRDMESRVPVPTDNIFKFYAMFGLLLFIFCCGAMLYVTRASNDVVFATLPELEGLRQNSTPSKVEQMRIALLERKLEINKADKTTFKYMVGVLVLMSLCLLLHGFKKWQSEVQPIIDRMAKAQLDIAELQLEKLRRELGVNRPEPNAAQPSAGSATRGEEAGRNGVSPIDVPTIAALRAERHE